MRLIIKGPPSQGFSHHFRYDQCSNFAASFRAENRPGGDAPLWYSRYIALCMQLGWKKSMEVGVVSEVSDQWRSDDQVSKKKQMLLWDGNGCGNAYISP